MIMPGHMGLPSVSRRTIIRILPAILLAIIALISISLLELTTLEPVEASSHILPKMSSAAAALKSIIVPPRAPHTATIIFSHGLGDTGDGWKPVATMLASQFPYAKWILPHAPVRPITINGGLEMPGWFDLYSLGKSDDQEDEEGILKSSALIKELVEAENAAGIPNERIVIGGFSQGAALSLVHGLTTEKKYAGLAILSGWFPMRNRLQSLLSSNAASTQIFWGHGTSDGVVPYKFGQLSVQHMQKNLNFANIQFNSYKGMAHSADQQEIADLGAWLRNIIPPS
ncbi:Phospholipase/carboxylesterase [Rhizoctonia solani]|nr:Phospholipase/carboxylesterase [Rhizoctonia solani]